MLNKKKGLSHTFIVSLVILIIGFLILLTFLNRVDFGGQIDRAACKQSVIYRGTIANLPIADAAKSIAELRCKEKKICITASMFGNCPDFENEKGIVRARVKDKTGIERVIAQEILECWETFGQGRLDLFSDFLLTKFGVPWKEISSSCAICTRIAFDSESLSKIGVTKENFEKIDVVKYMATHAVPNQDVSYLFYMTGKQISAQEVVFGIEPDFDLIKEDSDNGDIVVGELEKWQGKQIAILFMQIVAPEHGQSLKNSAMALAGAGTGGFILVGKSSLVTKGVAAVGGGWAVALIVGTIAAGVVGTQQVHVSFQRAATFGYCADVNQEGRGGCSVVRMVYYEPKAINQFCDIIESIP